MFNVVRSALRTKKDKEISEPKSPKESSHEIRLVTSGETHKNELVGLGGMPPHEELKASFEALLVCKSSNLHKPPLLF